MTQYIPSARPGARFPHINFLKNTAPTASHDLLDYRYSSFFIREKGALWKTALQQLPIIIQQKIKVFRLDELGFSEKVYKELIALCEIDGTGALLIRPDGHVAWRTKSFKGNPTEELQQVFQHFFQIKTNVAS